MTALKSKDKIEEVALEEYEWRLHQIEATPLMSEPLVKEFGFLGVGPAVKAIANGMYVPLAGVDHHMTDWLG